MTGELAGGCGCLQRAGVMTGEPAGGCGCLQRAGVRLSDSD